jgi:hypothetical protein
MPTSRTCLGLLALAALCLGFGLPSDGAPDQLEVVVTFDGTETVDEARPLYVILFDGPGMGAPGSRLLAMRQIDRNGGSAFFDDLPETVYVSALYDPSGQFTGLSGVIPGSVAGAYAVPEASAPSPVTVRGQVEVTVALDATQRMPGDPESAVNPALAKATDGIVEIRTYTLRPGTRERFVSFFEQRTLEIQAEAGLDVVGQFRSLEDPDTFVWIRSHDSERDRIDHLRDFYLGDDWLAVQDEALSMIADTSAILVEPTKRSRWR